MRTALRRTAGVLLLAGAAHQFLDMARIAVALLRSPTPSPCGCLDDVPTYAVAAAEAQRDEAVAEALGRPPYDQDADQPAVPLGMAAAIVPLDAPVEELATGHPAGSGRVIVVDAAGDAEVVPLVDDPGPDGLTDAAGARS